MILLLDTCGETGSIVMAESARVIASATLPGRSASERLLATIRTLAADNAIALNALSVIAIVHGPGSFTGVRVGLSAAKGLCEALGLPLVAISRLNILAGQADAPSSANVHAILDAGRGEFYWGHYTGGVCVREALLTRDELLAVISQTPSPLTVVCEAAVAESLALLSPRLVSQPDAEAALPLVLTRIRAQQYDDVAAIDANYLRRTDAEIFAKSPRPTAAIPEPQP